MQPDPKPVEEAGSFPYHERVAELVESALERDPAQRSPFLDDACAGDVDLRREAESLLAFHEAATDFIEKPAYELAAETIVNAGELKPKERLGDYKIVSLIGEGGMGEVYLADDTSLGRKVAIKLLKFGFGTANIIRHFHQEERILAGLTHPNIAQVHGGAVTANGLPYFVMEYVDGARLDDYCRENQLSIFDRLALFRKICSAVSYAHQHLVIHRDLKPANIRVTADGEPKLLDFGIAKLVDPATPNLLEQTITLRGVMTPEYASPEQVRGEPMTTASDVYSLGVVLYELLTGQRPYRIKTRRPDEIARIITEQEPTRPSAASKDQESSDSQFTIHHSRSLRGDLDNIILMALRKEPARRYVSVAQFSEDIRRHLAARPVVARKDTLGYRTFKFVARNRIAVSATAMVALAIIVSLIVALGQAQNARQQRDVAEREKSKAEATKNFLERTIGYSDPLKTGKSGRETTLAEVLDEAAKRLEGNEFSNQPEIRAELLQVISQSYSSQGKYQQAQEHIQEVVSLLRQLYGEHHPKTIAASARWAQSLFFRDKIAESEKIYRQILPLMREEQKKGNINAAELADALNDFASLRRTQGDSREAETLFRETVVLIPQIPIESRYLIGTTRSTLASTLADQGRFEEALQTSREAVAEYRNQRRTDIPDFGFALTILGGFLTENGAFSEAEVNLREAEAVLRKHLAPTSLWLGDNLRNQAVLFYQQGRYDESLHKVTETLKIYREGFGTHYDHYPTALITQGLSQAKTGQLKEAEKNLREAVKIRTESLPKEHYWVALANSSLGECLTIQKRYQEAEPLLLDSYERLKKSQGSSNPRTGLALQRLVELYDNWGKADAAAEYRMKLPDENF
jgi:serine/threonine-protein kinase